MDTYDGPWKQICDAFFPDMMRLYQQDLYDDIDWEKPVRSLDKELPKLRVAHKTGARTADKLMEVHLKEGGQGLLYLHVEFQHQKDADLAFRMYTYNYRIFDKYQTPVISIAILGDENENWAPDHFGYAKGPFRLSMDYPVTKLIHYRDRLEELAESDNPFAIVTEAHLASLATSRHSQDRLRQKMALTRRMYKKGFSRRYIVALFTFIDWVLQLPKELEQQFRQDLEALEGETNMPYITSIERMAREEGEAKGFEQGLERGIEQGLARSLLTVLTHRFGPLDAGVRARINEADPLILENWLNSALEVPKLADLFQN